MPQNYLIATIRKEKLFHACRAATTNPCNFAGLMKRALLYMHTAVLLWGFTGVLGRAISLDFAVLVWWRMFLTAILVALIITGRRNWRKVAPADVLRLTFIGCLIGIHWVAFYGAIKFANASIALICLSTASVFTALLDPLVNKGKFVASELLLGLLAIGGVYLIYHGALDMSTGVFLGVIAAILSAIFTVLNKKIAHKYPARVMVFYEMTAGWLLISVLLGVVLAAGAEQWLISPQNPAGRLIFWPSLEDWLWLLVLALCCTVWAQSLALSALKQLSSFTVTLSVNLEPVYGIALAFLFYQEQKDLHASFYWGMGLIILSVAFQMLRLLRPKMSPGMIQEKGGLGE